MVETETHTHTHNKGQVSEFLHGLESECGTWKYRKKGYKSKFLEEWKGRTEGSLLATQTHTHKTNG